jgi:hypothetical protein
VVSPSPFLLKRAKGNFIEHFGFLGVKTGCVSKKFQRKRKE